MKALLRGGALFVAIVSVVWVAVLWRWQVTSRDMTTADILVWLGLLPLVLFGVVLLGRAAWKSAGEREEARTERAAATAKAEGKAAPAAADEAERHATVQLLAALLSTVVGDSAAALLSAAKDGEPRPKLDEELADANSIPILSARIAELDVSVVEASAEAALVMVRAQKAEWSTDDPGEHVTRALAALHLPLAGALETLVPWKPSLSTASPVINRTRIAPGQAAPAGTERSVRVLLGWPAEWSEFDQEFARIVATGWIMKSGADVLPGVRIVSNAQIASGEELLLQADHLMRSLARAQHDDPLIVATCHSAISAAAVSALHAAGRLYDPRTRPKGQIPGEGACVLVLAGASWPSSPDNPAPVPHLHRPSLLQRDKSVDAAGRVGPQVAAAAMTSALDAGRMKPDSVGSVVAAADQHTERSTEFFTASHDVFPALDPTEDLCSIGHITAAVGGVSALLVVACAAERATATAKPTLALAMADPFARLALLALPTAPPLPEPTGPAPSDRA